MLLSIIAAFAWDYFRTLQRPSLIEWRLVAYAEWVLERVDAGTREHALLAWSAAALLPALAVGAVGMLLDGSQSLPGALWGAVVIYLSTGYRRVAEDAVEVAGALRRDDLERVCSVLGGLGVPLAAATTAPELARVAVREVLLLALSRLFGVLFWYALLGPFGAVLFVLGRMPAERWPGESDFHATLARAKHILDWLPSRLMALSFAIVGNFENAMIGWRTGSEQGGNEAIVLAAGAGAMGMRLGHSAPAGAAEVPGAADFVEGALGLVWRMVLLWLGVLGLLWLGSL